MGSCCGRPGGEGATLRARYRVRPGRAPPAKGAGGSTSSTPPPWRLVVARHSPPPSHSTTPTTSSAEGRAWDTRSAASLDLGQGWRLGVRAAQRSVSDGCRGRRAVRKGEEEERFWIPDSLASHMGMGSGEREVGRLLHARSSGLPSPASERDLLQEVMDLYDRPRPAALAGEAEDLGQYSGSEEEWGAVLQVHTVATMTSEDEGGGPAEQDRVRRRQRTEVMNRDQEKGQDSPFS